MSPRQLSQAGIAFKEMQSTVLHPASAKGQRIRVHHLKIDLELGAHCRTEAVVKLAELRACDVILHISRVEVASNIENSRTDARSLSAHLGDKLWYRETFRNLHG